MTRDVPACCQRLSQGLEGLVGQASHESNICPSAADGVVPAQYFELLIWALHARSITHRQINAGTR